MTNQRFERNRRVVIAKLRVWLYLSIVALVGLSAVLLWVLSWPIYDFTAVELIGYAGAVMVNIWMITTTRELCKYLNHAINVAKRWPNEPV